MNTTINGSNSKIIAITAVLVVSVLCNVNAQTIQRIYGDNYVGSVNRFEFSGENANFVGWESTGNYVWDYFGPDALHVRWKNAGDFYVTAIYNDLSTGEDGKRVTYPVSIVNSPFPPAAPSGLVVSASSPTAILLTWVVNSTNEAGFSIERSITSGSGFAQIGTTGANITHFQDSGLTPGTRYYYRVRATNPAGSSAYTAQVSAITPNPPNSPSNLVATTVSYGQINLTWTDNSTNETGFQIIMQEAADGGGFIFRGVVTTAANGTSYSDTGLKPGTQYLYRVRSINESGESAATAEVTATTLVYPLKAPTKLVATTASATQIDLAWSDNSTNETGFQIERSLTLGGAFTLIATTTANVTTYSNTGLPAGTRYYYRVRAIDAGGASTYTLVVGPFIRVNAGIDRTISGSSVTIIGTVTPSGAGAVNSYLWEKVSGATSAMLANTATSSATVTGMIPGTYVFRFSAKDVYGSWERDEITLTVEEANTTNSYNYVKEITPFKKGVLEAQIGSLPVGSKSERTSYLDGLGRPIQEVNWNASPNQKDIVQPVAYDAYGRDSKTFLPYVSTESNGAFKKDALTDPSIVGLPELTSYRGGRQYEFYQTGGNVPSDQFPYRETIFETSPLNRIKKVGGPGIVWQPSADPSQDKSVKKEYEFNKANEVLSLAYDSQTDNVMIENNEGMFFQPGALYANKIVNEHNNNVIEYTDKQGRIVCKKVQYDSDSGGNSFYAETYYIYDDFGNLVVVLPPEAAERFKLLISQH